MACREGSGGGSETSCYNHLIATALRGDFSEALVEFDEVLHAYSTKDEVSEQCG